MKLNSRSICGVGFGLWLLIAAATTPLFAAPLHYLAAGKLEAATLLAPPPLPDSPEQAADMNEVRTVFQARSSNDVAMAMSEKKFSVYTFTPMVGPFFQANSLPKTTAFFERVQFDAEIVTDAGKDFFKRPRPYTVDPSLANDKPEKSFSYPSGHSTESMVLALVLAEVFPEKQGAIVAKARGIGWRRVQTARHYPTDIYAGRVLAQAIVHEMNASASFQADLAEAKAEIASTMAATKQPEPATAATR